MKRYCLNFTCRVRYTALFCVICTLLSLSLPFVSLFAEGDVGTLDLSSVSDRYLSDFAIAQGGNISFDEDENIVFNITSAQNSLKFKCTGAFSSGEQNAVCIMLKNRTGSTRVSVEITFMDMDSEQSTFYYEKTVENSGQDAYLFIPSPENRFVVSVSLKVTGVGAGTVEVSGVWHCYYYFSEEKINKSIGLVNTLAYTEGGTSVEIEGTVLHDITISSKDGSINVWRLLPGEVLDDAFVLSHTPCASVRMSKSFSFTVRNRQKEDFASAYAVTINNPDGSIEYVLEEKRWPESAKYAASDIGFKGVATTLEYLPSEMHTSTLVIDISTEDLAALNRNGYLYTLGNENFYFNSDLIDTIDRRITSHTVNGGGVLLRFALSSADGNEKRMFYDADGEEAAGLYAMTAFICERYADVIDGIIVGNEFDVPYEYANLSGVSYTEYLRKYTDVLNIVSSASRNMTVKNGKSEVRIILPVSSNNSRVTSAETLKNKYPISAMMISLYEMFSQTSNHMLTAMVCDNTYPDVKALMGSEGTSADDSGNITSKSTAVFDSLLSYLSKSYAFTDTEYLLLWTPTVSYDKDELSMAYMYIYFNLCNNQKLYSFICDFTHDESLGYFGRTEMMADIMAVMGSDGAKEAADAYAEKYGLSSWTENEGYGHYLPQTDKILDLGTLDELPSDIKGTLSMTDFSQASFVAKWKKGVYAQSIVTDSAVSGKRTLRSVMTLPAQLSEYAELIYAFDGKKDLSAVSSIRVSMMLDVDEAFKDAKSTVKLVIGGNTAKGIAHYDVDVPYGTLFSFIIDTSDFENMSELTYLKICVQNDLGEANQVVAHIVSIDAYSATLDDEALTKLWEEKGKDNGQSGIKAPSGADYTFIVFFAMFAVAALSVFLILLYSRNRSGVGEEEEK